MNSFDIDIGERARTGSRFMARVHTVIADAFFAEKKERKLTQQAISERLGVHRSVVNRQIMGLENLTIRSVAEILWAMGWEPEFSARRIEANAESRANEFTGELEKVVDVPATTQTTDEVVVLLVRQGMTVAKDVS